MLRLIRPIVLAIAFALTATPLVFAHPLGFVLPFCQADTPGSDLMHDYMGSVNWYPAPLVNGNAAPCGTPRPAPPTAFPAVPGAFWDGDYEWGYGGAILAIETAGRSTPPQQSCGPCSIGAYDAGDLDSAVSGVPEGGAAKCWGMLGHHDASTIYAQDNIFGDYITLTVLSDYRRQAFDGQNTETQACGDSVIEPCAGSLIHVDQVNCNGRDCIATWGPALGTTFGPSNLPPAFRTMSSPCVSGQDGTVRVMTGSLPCTQSESLSGKCPPALRPFTVGTSGHIWTN